MISQKKVIVYLLIIFVVAFLMGAIVEKNFLPRNLIPNWRILQTSETINTDIDYDLFWEVWSSVKEKYVDQPVSDQDLFYGSLKGMVTGLDDPYSVFLNPDLSKKFLEDMSGSFEGIGIEIGIKEERLTVIAPLPDTPAFRAGLRSADKIYAIDKKDTIGISLDEAAHLIRGAKGTPVVLSIWRKGDIIPREVEIIRDVIDIKSVSWELMGNNIAYLKISHFSEDTWDEFKAISKVILNSNPNGLILDLRNNPGGYLDTAVNVAGYWLGKEIITISKDAKDKEIEYRSYGRADLVHIPTVVLVNQGSASASEILAGALQDYKQATILGENTFGKGSIQELETFFDGSSLKITVAYWYTPLGRSINEQGIMPDIEVELTSEDYELNRDPQLDQALEMLGGTPPIPVE